MPRTPRRSLAAVIVAGVALLAGCTGATSTTPSPSPVPSTAVTASAAPSASAGAMLPAELVGTWAGKEYEADTGETWDTTYRIQPCRQHVDYWWAPEDDQYCGDWTGKATFEDRPAQCEATLSWIEQDGDTIVFMASGPKGSAKYRTLPHPYVKIDDKWYCWDTFRVRMTPDAAGAYTVETIGAGSQSGKFVATSGTMEPTGP